MRKTALLFLNLLLSLSIFSQEEGFVKINDGVIHYKIFGEGEPLLIINGGPGLDCEGFTSLAELMSDKYMAILYDQRGTGKSKLNKVDSTTVTLDLMASDMEALRNHLNIKQWILLGHSFGGIMAQYYATLYPESIKGMILSSSGGIDLELLNFFNDNINIRLSEDEKDSLQYWKARIKDGDTSYYANYNKARFLARGYLYNRDYVPQIAARMAMGGAPYINDLVFKDLYKTNYDCKETLKDFEKPVLIIQGRQDLVGSETAYKAHLVFPNSTLTFIEKCCHYGWLEQEEKYKEAIVNFIESIS